MGTLDTVGHMAVTIFQISCSTLNPSRVQVLQDTAKLTHGLIPAFVSFVRCITAATELTHRASVTMDSTEMPAREVSYSVRL